MFPTKSDVRNKLIQLGSSLLKGNYVNNWSKNNPTYGYCYIVSEALFHYLNEDNIEVYCMNFGHPYGTHWFLKVNNEVIDYTDEQFPFEVPHEKAKRKGFFKGSVKTDKGFISRRGYEMAKILKLID